LEESGGFISSPSVSRNEFKASLDWLPSIPDEPGIASTVCFLLWGKDRVSWVLVDDVLLPWLRMLETVLLLRSVEPGFWYDRRMSSLLKSPAGRALSGDLDADFIFDSAAAV
jgi:hypothetical protein